MHLDCEGSHKVPAAVLGPVISPVNFSVKWLLEQSRTIFCIILIPIIIIINNNTITIIITIIINNY
jgi:hypothetical protein